MTDSPIFCFGWVVLQNSASSLRLNNILSLAVPGFLLLSPLESDCLGCMEAVLADLRLVPLMVA